MNQEGTNQPGTDRFRSADPTRREPANGNEGEPPHPERS